MYNYNYNYTFLYLVASPLAVWGLTNLYKNLVGANQSVDNQLLYILAEKSSTYTCTCRKKYSQTATHTVLQYQVVYLSSCEAVACVACDDDSEIAVRPPAITALVVAVDRREDSGGWAAAALSAASAVLSTHCAEWLWRRCRVHERRATAQAA